MLKAQYFVFVCILSFSSAFAQTSSLPLSQEIRDSYENGVRTSNGAPGENYWINRSEYDIEVDFDPIEGRIEGKETITYHNESPNGLNSVIIRLYQDVLKKGGIRANAVAPEIVNDGVEITKIVIGGEEVTKQGTTSGRRFWGGPSKGTYRRTGTNLQARLNESLASGKSVEIQIEWAYTFEEKYVRRMGHYGNHNWFIAYWYPQVAVYDDIDGWDRNHYTGTQEMYNDFSDYNVKITVPDSFAVWATGTLENAQEVLQPSIYQEFNRAASTDETVKIARAEDYEKKQVVKAEGPNTWSFKANHVPDFAFSVSSSLSWDASSVELEPGRRVLVNAVYVEENRFYDECAQIARKCLLDMSTKLPGIPYPYSEMNIFNGGKSGGGMEFPMIVNDGAVRNRADLIDLTYHEIVHTYFPFYMGINERKYGWMDEGWASILPRNLILDEEPKSGEPMMSYSLSYSRFAGTEDDVALMTPSKFLTGRPYSMHVYSKPASAYYILQDMLGEEVFKKAFQTYIKTWNGKHPLPYDFFFTFNKASGQNLDWFWKPWFFELGTPDLAIKEATVKGKKVMVKVEKVGNYPVPIHLTMTLEDGTKEEIHHTASVWANGETEFVIKTKVSQPVLSMQLGRPDFPDANRGNDTWTASSP